MNASPVPRPAIACVEDTNDLGFGAVAGAMWRAFFFSVETFATIGYGDITPIGFPAHAVMFVESLTALMSQALNGGRAVQGRPRTYAADGEHARQPDHRSWGPV